MTESPTIIQFPTGARRSGDAEAERYDLITPIGLRRLAETYAEGAAKHGERNWELGMPASALGVLWSRARENAGKLAMIHGCWKQRDSPAVDIESASWAIEVVTHVIKHTLYEAFLCVAESPFHERCLRIMQAIERAAGQRLRHRELTRATRSMTPREREEALQSLIEQGRVTTWTEDTGGRRAVWYGTA